MASGTLPADGAVEDSDSLIVGPMARRPQVRILPPPPTVPTVALDAEVPAANAAVGAVVLVFGHV